jgi:hypothetical protein
MNASRPGEPPESVANRYPLPTEAEFPGLDRLTEVARDVLKIEPPIRWSDDSTGRIVARLQRLDLQADGMTPVEAADAIEASLRLEPLVCCACRQAMGDIELGHFTCSACREAARATHMETMGPLVSIPKILSGDYANVVLCQSVDEGIKHLAAIKFGHGEFSRKTWNRLMGWFRFELGYSEEQVRALPRARVFAMLKAELSPPQIPVVAPLTLLNRFLGRSKNAKGILEKCEREKLLTFTRQVTANRVEFAVTMACPERHRDLQNYMDTQRARAPKGKTRKGAT